MPEDNFELLVRGASGSTHRFERITKETWNLTLRYEGPLTVLSVVVGSNGQVKKVFLNEIFNRKFLKSVSFPYVEDGDSVGVKAYREDREFEYQEAYRDLRAALPSVS
jgi:hypothetical protein